MAHRKAAGSTKNLTDSKPKYLGIKKSDGSTVKTGAVLVRQRGTKIMAGVNVGVGKDHTLFALKDGIVKFTSKRKRGFNNHTQNKIVANVEAQ